MAYMSQMPLDSHLAPGCHACVQVGADGGEAALAAWPAGRPAPDATFAAVAAYLSTQGLTPAQVRLSNLAAALLLHKCACDVQAAAG
jgi:hypothetical protein